MQITVTFRHMESSDALKAYAAEKVQKIAKYLPQAVSAHVIMWVEKINHHVEIFIDAGALHCRKKSYSQDMYKTIDEVADKITREVKKHREKLLSHKVRASNNNSPLEHHILAFKTDVPAQNDGLTHHIVEKQKMMIQTLSLDEALVQLDLNHEDFLVFKNISNQAVHILYRRDETHYGLIETT